MIFPNLGYNFKTPKVKLKRKTSQIKANIFFKEIRESKTKQNKTINTIKTKQYDTRFQNNVIGNQ